MKKTDYLLFFPFFAMIFIFLVFFIVWTAGVSFTDWVGVFPSYNFAGITAYEGVIGASGFQRAAVNTLVFVGAGVPLLIGSGLMVAITIDLLPQGKASSVMKTVAILSFGLAQAITGVLWGWIFNPAQGVINSIMESIGLENLTQSFLTDPYLVILAILITLIWRFSGYTGVVFYGAISSVPESHREAARIDGASIFQIYRYVLFPEIRGIILMFALLLSMMVIKTFGIIWTMTGGGPGVASMIFPVLIYRRMFSEFNFAQGAAAAMIFLGIIMIFAVPYIYFQYREGEF